MNELVLFFPFTGWLPNQVTDRAHQGLTRLAFAGAKACKVIFGPYVELENDNHHDNLWMFDEEERTVLDEGPMKRWNLTNVVQILEAASVGRAEVTIYGLERVKVIRDWHYPFFDTAEIPQYRYKWHNRNHRKLVYGPQELGDLVHHYLTGVLNSRSATPPVVRFLTIEEYMATNLIDELFSCEMESHTRKDSSWLSSKYWRSKSLWLKSPPIPMLAEGDRHESDTDEEKPRFKRPRPIHINAKAEKKLRQRQAYEIRKVFKHLGV
jgi:hypothetical protein